jgi:hypothetical protein
MSKFTIKTIKLNGIDIIDIHPDGDIYVYDGKSTMKYIGFIAAEEGLITDEKGTVISMPVQNKSANKLFNALKKVIK